MSTTPSYSRSAEARCAGQTDVCMYVCMYVEKALLKYTITAVTKVRVMVIYHRRCHHFVPGCSSSS